jgi:geranylgeranyl diphosphate synthase type II
MNTLSELLEMRLRAVCISLSDAGNVCTSAACEHFAAGGSRVRAHICLEAGVRLGLSPDDAICAALVCELLHNASLIQDDLLDRTTLRRGKSSVWVKHGDTVAVCTGDLMLSAAYGVLCELGLPTLIVPALRLVHQRTSEVILGQVAESFARQASGEATTAHYERMAKAKSASLLSLSLELPLLLSGNEAYLAEANAVSADFAVAYQVADDLADVVQDTQEGSSNLVLSLLERDGLTKPGAYSRAVELATARLDSAEKRAKGLPNHCATTLLSHAEKLRQTLAEHSLLPLTTAGV